MSADSQTHRAYFALTLAGLIWGSAFYFAKIAEPYVGVGHMMVIRFVLASLGFLPFLLRGIPRMTREDWWLVFLTALIGVPIQFLVQFEGLSRTTVSHAALMIGTAPVAIAVGAYFVFGDRLRLIAWVALAVSTAGVGLLLSPRTDATIPVGTQGSLDGDLLVLASIAAGATWVLMSKKLMERHPPELVSALTTILGTILLILWVIPQEGLPPLHFPLRIWGALLMLGVVTTTFTTFLWNYGLGRIPSGKAAVFINLEPVVGALLGVVFLGEALGAFAILGGILILGSAVVVSLS